MGATNRERLRNTVLDTCRVLGCQYTRSYLFEVFYIYKLPLPLTDCMYKTVEIKKRNKYKQ